MNDWLIALLLSAAPISEVRGGIPYAILKGGMHPALALVLCVLANIAIIPLVFLLLDGGHKVIERVGFLKRTVDAVLHRARAKVHDTVEKYGYWGLCVFVAIPLPGTGAWTGAIGAWALGMRRLPAFFAIAAGTAIAGILVLAVVLSGSAAFSWMVKVV